MTSSKVKNEAEKAVVIACAALTVEVLSGTDSWGSAQHMRNVGTRWAPSTNPAGCEVIAGMELHAGG